MPAVVFVNNASSSFLDYEPASLVIASTALWCIPGRRRKHLPALVTPNPRSIPLPPHPTTPLPVGSGRGVPRVGGRPVAGTTSIARNSTRLSNCLTDTVRLTACLVFIKIEGKFLPQTVSPKWPWRLTMASCTDSFGQDASPSLVTSQQCWYSFAAEYTEAN